MILPGPALADALILQTAQGRQHVHRRVDALAVQRPAQDDLPLGDIARQIRDGVGLVILRHGQDGDQRDGAGLAQLAARPLVDGGQVRVQIPREAPSAGDLLLGGGDLPQCLGVVGDVGHDDQHVHILLKGQILGGGQGHPGGGDALHGRVVGQIGEHDRPVNGAGALELADEELRLLKGDADGGKHHGELGGVVPQHLGLPGDLGRQIGVGQAGAGEDGKLLPTDQGVQPVDGADAGLNELVGVVPGRRVHGQAVDVPVLLRQDVGPAVDGPAHAVEHPAQHVGGHAQLQGVAQEADLGVRQVDAGGRLEQLDHGGVAVDLQHLAPADGAVVELHLHQLVIGDALDHADDHQGAGDLLDRSVFPDHASSPPSSAMAVISCSISAEICS